MQESYSALTALPMGYWLLAATLLGLVVGSFLNVVIHRLPIMLERDWRAQCLEGLDQPVEASEPFNLLRPRSRCPHCDHPIRAMENVPILSYLVQRGRCKGCGKAISLRYPLVEALTAGLTLFAVWHFGMNPTALLAVLFTWFLVCLIFIDIDHQLLPDDLTLPLLWLGLIVNSFGIFTDPVSSIFGAVAGYLSLWLVFQIFRLVTGKEGMGFGDFKLLAAIGAWLGWQYLPLVVLLSSAVGAALGLSMIALKHLSKGQTIPFGPYLAIAGWIALYWGDAIIRAYLDYALPGHV